MARHAHVLSIYASDTSGVCSALYELGGMVVVHDASGCNSTYATHDEPRWYRQNSMIFISALTETEAVMGGDAKWMDDIVRTADELNPAFIALCGSPLPMMTGTDYDAVASAVEARTGRLTLGLHTNGIRSYLHGSAEAFLALSRRLCPADGCSKTAGGPKRVNVLGMTPLDFGVNGSADAMRRWLTDHGMKLQSCWAMGSELSQLETAAEADVNLVVSSCGLPLAHDMKERFGIPYVMDVPLGRHGEDAAAALEGNRVPDAYPVNFRAAVIGEPVQAAALSAAIACETGWRPRVLCPLDCDDEALPSDALRLPDEDAVMQACRGLDVLYADPLYRPVVPSQTRFIPWPQVAFSGRCHLAHIPNLINSNFPQEMLPC